MANKWLAHVKKTMKSHKGMKFGQVLKMAKKSYKGGADVEPHSEVASPGSVSAEAAPVGGRRRTRKARKSRKGSRRA